MKKKIGLILLTILVVGIFICSLVACLDSDIYGRYYEYEGSQKQEDSWLELKSNKQWIDSDGVVGKYTVEDSMIVLYYNGTGLMSGTIEDGVITFTTWGKSVWKKDNTDMNENK